MYWPVILSIVVLSHIVSAQIYDVCHDTDINCSFWQRHGECLNNPRFMLVTCRLSCGNCFQAPGAQLGGNRFRLKVINLGSGPYTPGTYSGAVTTPTGGSTASGGTTVAGGTTASASATVSAITVSPAPTSSPAA